MQLEDTVRRNPRSSSSQKSTAPVGQSGWYPSFTMEARALVVLLSFVRVSMTRLRSPIFRTTRMRTILRPMRKSTRFQNKLHSVRGVVYSLVSLLMIQARNGIELCASGKLYSFYHLSPARVCIEKGHIIGRVGSAINQERLENALTSTKDKNVNFGPKVEFAQLSRL